MEEVKVFQNSEFGEVRTIIIDNEPWFVASDICNVLNLSNTTMAVQRLDEDEKSKLNLGLAGGEINCVNEYGLYSLVLASRKPEAREFKRWITHEVLPSIREHGMYAKDELLDKADLSPQMKLLYGLCDQLAQTERQANEAKRIADTASQTASKAVESVENIKEAVKPVLDNWRPEINAKFNRIQKNADKQFNILRSEMYQELEHRAGCDLNARLRNKRKRLEDEGCQKSKINSLNKMDVIEQDKKLREIFSKIVSEYEIKYCV